MKSWAPLALIVALGVAAGAAGGRTLAQSSGSTSNGDNSFSAAGSFGGCTPATPQYLTGWETGNLITGADWSLLSGTAETIDSAVKRNGAYSAKVTKVSGANAALTKSYTTNRVGTEMYSFALRLDTLPAADARLMIASSATGSALVLGYQASTQKLTLAWGTGSPVLSTMLVAPGTWYTIDLKVDTSANPRVGEWQVDGVAQTSVSVAEAAADQVSVAFGSNTSTDVVTANYDDFFHYRTASQYPVGAVRIGSLRPNGMGTHNGVTSFQDEDSTAVDANSYTRLDDQPMNSIADGIKQVTASGTSYVELTLADTAETCITGVIGVIGQHKAGAGGNTMKTSVFDGSTERVVYSGDGVNTSLVLRDAVITPATSPWSQSAVNELVARIGYATDVNPIPTWDAFMLEVAGLYTPPAPSSSCTAAQAYRVTGFEHGVLNTSLFSEVQGATLDTAVRRSGANSVKVAKTSGVSTYLSLNNETGITANVVSFGFRFASLPTADVERLMYITTTSGGSRVILGYRQTTNKLFLRWGTGPFQYSTMTMSAGTWYSIEIRANTATSTKTADWRVDGVDQPQAMTSSSGIDQLSVVFGSDFANDVFTANFDDYFRSTTLADYPVGPMSVRPMRPNGMGTNSGAANFTEDDSTGVDANTYTRLNDSHMSYEWDAVRQTTASGSSYIELTLEDTSETCIKGVQGIVAQHKGSTPANNMKTSVFDGATERVIHSGDTGAQTVIQKTAVVNPATSPWTQSAVNGLVVRFGYSTDIAPQPIWDSLLLEYAVPYTGSAPVGYRETVLGDAPVGYWRLGDVNNFAADEARNSGGSYGGTTHVLGQPGALPSDADTSVDFSGNLSYMTVPHVAALNLTTQASLEAWIKPDTVTGRRGIINKLSGDAYSLYIADNRLVFGIHSGAAYPTVEAVGVATTGEWQHIVGTFDGSTLTLYRNGVKVAEGSCTCPIEASSSSLYVGSMNMTTDPFDGGIDEVAVYPTGLTATQVQTHYERR